MILRNSIQSNCYDPKLLTSHFTTCTYQRFPPLYCIVQIYGYFCVEVFALCVNAKPSIDIKKVSNTIYCDFHGCYK